MFSINPTSKDSLSLKGVKLLRPVDNLVMKRFPPDSISVCCLFTPVTTANSCLMRCVTQPQLEGREYTNAPRLQDRTYARICSCSLEKHSLSEVSKQQKKSVPLGADKKLHYC